MKFIYLTLFSVLSYIGFANVTVYFNYGVFSSINTKPYLETYLTISGNSVKYLPKKDGYQASVSINWQIIKGTEMVKQSTYNLFSPIVNDSTTTPSFIDNQRFSLPNGEYILKFEITDNANPTQKTTHTEKITVSINRELKINGSDIQILESYSKSKSNSALSKNGYDLIPYTINYFPKNQNFLKFYFEGYNVDTVLGQNTKFVYTYSLENAETLSKLNNFSGFQKQKSNKINPLLAQFDITQLPTGNYNLVIELRDSTNTVKYQKKWFFQRNSDAKEIKEEEVTNTIDDFFKSFNSVDTLKEFIECIWPISKTAERSWQQTQIQNKNVNTMQNYLIDYWKAKAGDTLNPFKLWKSYYQEVIEAKAMFKCGKQKGYYTDRGRVYLQYGKPSQRGQYPSSNDTYPYEIWQYYRIYDKTTNHFFTNKRFVFVNFGIADECYELIYSEIRGEKNDPNWKFRLVKRTQGRQNVDDNSPKTNYGNNFEDNFNNPR